MDYGSIWPTKQAMPWLELVSIAYSQNQEPRLVSRLLGVLESWDPIRPFWSPLLAECKKKPLTIPTSPVASELKGHEELTLPRRNPLTRLTDEDAIDCSGIY